MPGSVKPKTIEFTFKPDGTAEIATAGFTGKECAAASLPYERALGTVTSDRPTAEARPLAAEVRAEVEETRKHTAG